MLASSAAHARSRAPAWRSGRPARGTRASTEHGRDQLVAIDREGDGAPHTAVGEATVAEVEREVVDARARALADGELAAAVLPDSGALPPDWIRVGISPESFRSEAVSHLDTCAPFGDSVFDTAGHPSTDKMLRYRAPGASPMDLTASIAAVVFPTEDEALMQWEALQATGFVDCLLDSIDTPPPGRGRAKIECRGVNEALGPRPTDNETFGLSYECTPITDEGIAQSALWTFSRVGRVLISTICPTPQLTVDQCGTIVDTAATNAAALR